MKIAEHYFVALFTGFSGMNDKARLYLTTATGLELLREACEEGLDITLDVFNPDNMECSEVWIEGGLIKSFQVWPKWAETTTPTITE